MGAQDNALRPQALPFLGQVMGYNRNESSDLNVSSAVTLGDLTNLATGGTPTVNNMVRILRPHYGTIVAAYLDFTLNFAATETNSTVSFSVSYVNSNTDLTAVVPTNTQIQSNMTAIFGSPNAIQAQSSVVGISGANIFPLIPKNENDPNFRNSCFVIGVHFSSAPINTGTYALTQFRVSMSTLVEAK